MSPLPSITLDEWAKASRFLNGEMRSEAFNALVEEAHGKAPAIPIEAAAVAATFIRGYRSAQQGRTP